jgi:tetratricopeptide (TPR) repeat protein
VLEAISEPETTSDEAARAAAEAKVCAEQGQWDDARAAMARAIDADASNATFHALMGWYTSQSSLQPATERQRLAEHHLGVALEIDQNSCLAHYYQGLIWAGGGNGTRARIAFNNALSINPKFQPAQQALERISKGPAEPTGSSEVPRPNAYRRAGKRRTAVVPLAIATLAMAVIGGVVLYLLQLPPGASELARQLGTHLPIASASRAGNGAQDLYVDFGKSWQALSKQEQDEELHTIANGARAMAIVNVFVSSQSRPVAEIHGETVCVGDCVSQPLVQPASGAAQATLKTAKP